MQHAIPRARVESTHGTDLGPGPGLAAACRAARMHAACIYIFEYILCCMFYDNVSYVHAACHAKKLRGSLSRLDLRADSLNMRCTRLTVSDD